MDNADTKQRMNDVYNKWEKKGPSAGALEGGKSARSSDWDQAFDSYDVSADRVERRMTQTKPRRRRGGRGGGRGGGGGRDGNFGSHGGGFGAVPLARAPYAPSFSFTSGLNLPNCYRTKGNLLFCGLCCTKCTPFSRGKFYTNDMPSSGFKDMLKIQQPRKATVLSKLFPVAYSSFTRNSPHTYGVVGGDILSSNRVRARIEDIVQTELEVRGDDVAQLDEASVRKSVNSRAVAILSSLYSCLRVWGIRFHSWFLHLAFGRLMTSLDVRHGQIKMLKEAAKEGIPIVIVPTHRSHLDSLALLFSFFESELKLPRIVAGDNLKLPVVSSLVRNHGAFFIRRRLDNGGPTKDTLYRGILQEYVEQLLKQNEWLLFYLEGSRSRTGRVGLPKGGLLSVVVDAVIEGAVPDVYIVPTSISYDRTLDSEAFGNELMGKPKQKETFWGALVGLWQMVTACIGQVRIDLGQPFSVNEYIRQHRRREPNQDTTLAVSRSDSLSSDQRTLVESLANHVSFGCQQVSPVMSTQILACLLLTRFRDGVELSRLLLCYKWLHASLLTRECDVGFHGSDEAAVEHACRVLSDVISIAPLEVNGEGEVVDDQLVTPVLSLPGIFQIATSASQVLPAFLAESILACSLHSMVYSDHNYIENVSCEVSLEKSELLVIAEEVCSLLRHEFVMHPPCQTLNAVLANGITRLEAEKVIVSGQVLKAHPESHFLDEEDAHYDHVTKMKLFLNPLARKHLQFLQAMLCPVLEVYWMTGRQLCLLLDEPMEEAQFISEVLDFAMQRVENGLTKYPETVAIDPVRNAVKVFLADGVIESEPVEGKPRERQLRLTDAYVSQGAIDDYALQINDLIA